jgi:guanosine-3',5'-bis(diphosphate) 3'-pyrophosphohydrolase
MDGAPANMNKNPDNDRRIEQAIKFLVFSFHESGHNPKPVILHSIRTGIHLYNLGYNTEIVIGAILHDTIEDTDITINEIKSNFGISIARLVEANSFDINIEDETERYKQNFERCLQEGKSALIIKAADLFDNADYYHLAETKGKTIWLIGKLKYFIDISEEVLRNEPIYDALVSKCNKVQKVYGST